MLSMKQGMKGTLFWEDIDDSITVRLYYIVEHVKQESIVGSLRIRGSNRKLVDNEGMIKQCYP